MKLTYFIAVSAALAFSPLAGAQHCGGAPSSGAPSGCCAKPSSAESAAGACDHSSAAAQSKNQGIARKPLPAEVASIFSQYTVIQKALAADSTRGLSEAAAGLGKAIRASGSGCLAPAAQSADRLAKAADLDAARREFAAVSDMLVQYLALAGYLPGELREAYCPMAKARWLQKDGDLANPYMGKAMLKCGSFRS